MNNRLAQSAESPKGLVLQRRENKSGGRKKKREKGKGRESDAASSCRTVVASSMLLCVGFEEFRERRTSVRVAGPIGQHFRSGWETLLCWSMQGGRRLGPGQTAGRGQSGTACMTRHGCKIWLIQTCTPPPPTPSGERKNRRLCPLSDLPTAHKGTVGNGLNAIRVKYKLPLPLTSLQQVPGPSLSLRRKSPGKPVTQPSDQAFSCQIAAPLLLLLLLLLPPDVSALPGLPSSGIIIPVHLVAAPQCCCRMACSISPYLEEADGG